MTARTTLRVTRADLDDATQARAILELIDCYARDELGGGAPLPEAVRAALVPALREFASTLVFLAWEGPCPVGVAVCFRGFSTFAARPLVNIHDLSVRPGSRGRGVGRALLRAVADWARAHDCCKLTLEVLDHNAHARGLYESEGFGPPDMGHPGEQMLFLSKAL
ncbi:MAG: GNAT family N-acetyltransferase [Gammaproteobacteria bacterium]|nr:GNAT family N-acetyltransferase [Gammaproteobacteria bacterium]